MKSKKSKTVTPAADLANPPKGGTFFDKKKEIETLSARELKLLKEEKLRTRQERWRKVKKTVGQFFMLLFILAVIFSMIAIPLLIVFG